MDPVNVNTEVMETRKPLSAEQIFAADDLKTIDVEVPEWNGYVRLRMLSTTEAVEFVDSIKKGASTLKENVEEAGAELISLSAIDDAGNRLFTPEKARLISKKAFRAFLRLQSAAIKLNGLNDDLFGADAKKG